MPLLSGDYCFIRDREDEGNAKVLVCKLEPANLMLTTVVDEKGPEESTVARLAQFMKDSGYMHIVYRSTKRLQ